MNIYPMLLEGFVFLIAGMAAGILSSLFGIGGGLVVVPVLYWALKFQDIPVAFIMHLAVGTSLAVMIVTAMTSAQAHHKKGNVLWPVVKVMRPWIVLGVIVGVFVSRFLHSEILRYGFIIFLIYTIVVGLIKKTFATEYKLSDFQLPSKMTTAVICIITGTVGVLLGVGGSVITVPFMRSFKMPMRNAAACAAALTPAVAIVGTLGYMVMGWHINGLPSHCLGFIDIPAFLGLAIGSFIGVPVGAHWIQKLPDKISAKLYIAMLIIMVITMLV